MEDWLLDRARRFWPDLETASELERALAALDLFGILYSVPLAVGGLVWLAAVTDLALVQREWPTLLLLLAFQFLFSRLDFFFFIETPGARSSQFSSNFEPMVTWSAALVFGPTALWLAVLVDLMAYLRQWGKAASTQQRGETIRNLALNLVSTILASLIALALYQGWGGVIPIPGLTPEAALPALGATLVHMLLQILLYVPMLVYVAAGWSSAFSRSSGWLSALIWGLVITMGAIALVELFAILAAGLYAQDGPGVYLVFLSGLLLVGWLAHRLSMYLERSQQRSRELAKLDGLGRAILRAPADASTLPDLLAEHVSGMFSRSQLEINLFPEQTILHDPDDWPPVAGPVWDWLRANPEAASYLPKTTFPWDQSQQSRAGVVLAPILEDEGIAGAQPAAVGGIFLSRRWDPKDVASLLPAVQSLAAQIAAALHRAEVYRIERELAVAGQIQASFLPEDLPEIPGWQLAATLEPARETSGDFYDVIPLPEGRWGILVADVADKGTGAALYMALSRTLIRTYAIEHAAQPALALRAANRRILADARAEMFVTVFYGVLNPVAGTLTYCNAGHNPPYLLAANHGDAVQALTRTGLPLGILEEEVWDECTVHLPPGSATVLYTDGVTEAQDPQTELFGKERLLEVLGAHRTGSAREIQEAVLAAVRDFAPGAPQDDITLLVAARDSVSQ